MKIRTKTSFLTLLLIVALGVLAAPASALGGPLPLPELHGPGSELDSRQVGSDPPAVLREILVDPLTRLPIVQQPGGNITFVSSAQNAVTEYQTAAKFGTVGLLAHNTLAGRYFFQLMPGQQIELVYSDGQSRRFVVTELKEYQALAPDSPASDFIDLATGERLTASQVFRKTYGNKAGRLVLQTCIAAGQNPSWGRLFVIAEPADQVSAKSQGQVP